MLQRIALFVKRSNLTTHAAAAFYSNFTDLTEIHVLQRSITMEGYKLILYPKAQKARLYHLEEDPLEMEDLSQRPRERSRMRRLFSQLLALQQSLGDSLPLENVFTF